MEQSKQLYFSVRASRAALKAKQQDLDNAEAECISGGAELRAEIKRARHFAKPMHDRMRLAAVSDATSTP